MSGGARQRVPEQRAAADPAVSAWVSANAGSGKTSVLTDRVMRHLLSGTAPARLLCITFTKAAAAEMANRLHKSLGAWVTAEDDDLIAELSELMGRPPRDEELAPARRLFARALEAPGGLKIQTIHAFCESVLRRFPLEAGISPHFDVMDERTTAETLSEAMAQTIRRVADSDTLLPRIAARIDEAGFGELIREVIGKSREIRQLVAHHGSVDALIAAQYAALGLDSGDTADRIIDAACRSDAVDTAGLEKAADALAAGAKSDRERSAGLRQFLAAGEGRVDLFDSYCSLLLTKQRAPRSSVATKAIRENDVTIEFVLRNEQERLVAVWAQLRALDIAERTADLMRIGTVMLAQYDAIKRRRARLDYDDLILKTRGLLHQPAVVPWVLFKLDGGLDHILVDEAQDTSPEQWDIIVALAEEFFSGAGARDRDRTIFAVGDEKQSIYSFQGADPTRFDEMRAFFSHHAAASGGAFHPVDLVRSFRSTPVVLQLIDQVFADDAANDGLSADNRPVSHLAERVGEPGLAELWPPVQPLPTPEADPWDAPVDQLSMQSAEVRLADRIADRIAHWLAEGEILAASNRPMRAGDIMILVRRRNAFVEELIRQLKTRGVSVAGSDRMVLTEQIAVMDLMAIGRFVLMPEDDLCLAELLKSPFFGFDDMALFDLAHDREGSLWAALSQRRGEKPAYGAAVETLRAWLARADFQPPYEFFAHILGADGGRRLLQSRLGADALDPIEEFLGLALAFERLHVPSLQGFMHWFSAGSAEIKRDLEQGRDEVRVMTVHGAKGLQAPVVILPDCCTVPLGRLDPKILTLAPEPLPVWGGRSTDDDPQTAAARARARAAAMREYRRLLYVALTRARDRLYVCGFETKRGRGDDCWYDLIEPAFAALGAQIDLPWGETGWRLGQAPRQERPSKPSEPPVSVRPAWLDRPAPPEPTPPVPRAPSRPSDTEPAAISPLAGGENRRFRRGLVTHRLLQSLPDIAPADRQAEARRFVARRAHDLPPAAVEQILSETFAILEDPAFAALFGEGSRAEVPITGVVGDAVVSGQVDRLLVTADQVIVADYKTNRPPPETVAAVPTIYVRQMAFYRALLTEIYPDREVRCLLIWTDGPRAMALPAAILDGVTTVTTGTAPA